jgi:site-specific recombinase XerC
LDNLGEETDENDIWSYCWGSPFYSSQKAYKILIGTHVVDLCYKWLWKAAAQKKHKVFFWLLTKDRLSTRNIDARIELYHLTTVFSAHIQWKKLWNICFCTALLQAAVGLCST